jgi:hypothetical protein
MPPCRRRRRRAEETPVWVSHGRTAYPALLLERYDSSSSSRRSRDVVLIRWADRGTQEWVRRQTARYVLGPRRPASSACPDKKQNDNTANTNDAKKQRCRQPKGDHGHPGPPKRKPRRPTDKPAGHAHSRDRAPSPVTLGEWDDVMEPSSGVVAAEVPSAVVSEGVRPGRSNDRAPSPVALGDRPVAVVPSSDSEAVAAEAPMSVGSAAIRMAAPVAYTCPVVTAMPIKLEEPETVVSSGVFS